MGASMIHDFVTGRIYFKKQISSFKVRILAFKVQILSVIF